MTHTTTTIRVSTETHQRLTILAQKLNMPLQEATARAVSLLADQLFWQESNAAYSALRDDPVASAAFDAEISAWDATLPDGLEDQA